VDREGEEVHFAWPVGQDKHHKCIEMSLPTVAIYSAFCHFALKRPKNDANDGDNNDCWAWFWALPLPCP